MFEAGKVYKRSSLHDHYGGSRQSGISTPKDYPYIFIFSGKSGHQHGYRDGWINPKVFSYTGEGQKGDMEFVRGNLALRDHIGQGKRVFLFETDRKAYVKYICELEFLEFGFFQTHDTQNQERRGIKFFFKKAGEDIGYNPNKLNYDTPDLSKEYQFKKPNTTERSGLVTSRVGQGAYRKSVMHRWEFKCAVTQYNDVRVLIASHIVPWKDATDNERLDVDNGILLSPQYDALFDKHMISFENSGKIILTDDIQKYDLHRIGITGKEHITDLSEGNKKYLEQHRNQLS